VVELIEDLIGSDLAAVEPRLRRHELTLGTDGEDQPVLLPPYGVSVLLVGPSGGGKSTLALMLLEQLMDHRYQFCLLDPEGDYAAVAGPIVLGDADRAPSTEEILQVLKDPLKQVVANLLGVPLADRPASFAGLLPRLQELRARAGRPHWVILDEAHHLVPAHWEAAGVALPREAEGFLAITHDPAAIAGAILDVIDVVVAVGADPADAIHSFCQAIGQQPPEMDASRAGHGEALVWFRHQATAPILVHPGAPRTMHRRHVRKYIEGELSPELSFYFRGPAGALNLRAQNLAIFSQMAEGVDDATWRHHLHRGDYEQWFREVIHDSELATETAKVAADTRLPARESRSRILAAIKRLYTL
jgi:hypothetical protein